MDMSGNGSVVTCMLTVLLCFTGIALNKNKFLLGSEKVLSNQFYYFTLTPNFYNSSYFLFEP